MSSLDLVVIIDTDSNESEKKHRQLCEARPLHIDMHCNRVPTVAY